MNFKYLFLYLSLFTLTTFISKPTSAQALDSILVDSIRNYEFRLMGLSREMVSSFDELTRISSGKSFIINLSRALRIPNSYFYPFDSVKHIIILKSPDDMFRIMTWNVATNDEKFRYFGVIQMNPLKLEKMKDKDWYKSFFPLIDRSDSINSNTYLFTETDANHWFGAAYYKIIKTSYKKKDYYTLLGWDGADRTRNKKIADILFFRDGSPYFGAPLFDMKKKRPFSRLVYEFNNQASMGLRYDEKQKLLLIENIVPDKPANAGNFEFYYPDGSFDALSWKNGKWEKQKGIIENPNAK